MVRAGLALAYRQYSMRYVDLENAARADREGMWAGLFVEPWTWRRSGNASLTEAGTEIDQSDTPSVNSLTNTVLDQYDDNNNGSISCKEARKHGIAPVTNASPAYAFMNDRDGDGVVCE